MGKKVIIVKNNLPCESGNSQTGRENGTRPAGRQTDSTDDIMEEDEATNDLLLW
jgi:hypothetical protein